MTYTVHEVDVLEALRAMPDNSFHGCLTDPPYGLTKDGGKTGFMGHTWDKGVPPVEVWREVLRVLKPGAHLLAFGGTRTFHRLTCAIEDAGFEIRDSIAEFYDQDAAAQAFLAGLSPAQRKDFDRAFVSAPILAWNYASGFPKSHDVSKAIDREAGAVREVVGPDPEAGRRNRSTPQFGGAAMNEYDPGYDGPLGRMAITAPATEAARQWSGYGSALKPAYEPVIVARKPLTGTLAANCQEHGCGGLAIDACRVGTTKDVPSSSSAATGIYQNGHKALDARGGMDPNIGRWPANVILDEYQDPIMRLMGNVGTEVARVVGEYFGQLQVVREPDINIPKQGIKEEVLREGLLRVVAIEGDGGGSPPNVRQEASPRHDREDEVDQDRARSKEARPDVHELEGRHASDEGLSHGHGDRAGTDDVCDNDSEGVRPGASPGHGKKHRQTAFDLGGCPPPERRKGGQQDREPGTVGQPYAQARASVDCGGTSPTATGKRSLEVRASEIPAGWLRYFEPTGRHVRCGAGAALDAMSGERPSGVAVTRNGGGGKVFSGVRQNPDMKGHGARADSGYFDSGGASRFFYCAKASRKERDAGLEDFAAQATSRYGEQGQGPSPQQTPRKPVEQRNIHPTVKPLALTTYLARLILPPVGGSRLLIPFCGSGSEMIGALQAGWSHVEGIDSWDVAVKIARARLAHHEAQTEPANAEQLTLEVGT